ncbi:hypothetical protein D3C72_2524640 [compost metagenome]
MGFAFLHHVDAREVALEDHRKRGRVRHVEKAQRRDGDVELHRIDIAPEHARGGAALDDGGDLPHQG